MEIQKNKIAIFIVAQNHAGKTTVQQAISEQFDSTISYSVREIIYQSYRSKYGTPLLEDREKIQNFSQIMKRTYGSQYFIKKALQRFQKSTAAIGIVESVRAPGEALWLQKVAEKEFPTIEIILIALTAKKEDRYKRFLTKRVDNISPILTLEEFDHQDAMVNKGVRDWEENVEKTMRYADRTITNNNGELERVKKQVKSIIDFYL